MIFTLEHDGNINCRLMCNEIRGPLVQFNDIPYSKFLGYICEHIFETMRQMNKHENFINETMIEVFKKFPIKFAIAYKNNTEFNQGASADIRDCNPIYKEGESKRYHPSFITRIFNKQIVVAFHFVNPPEWVNEFATIWKNRPIDLKGAMDTKKNIVESIKDITFKYDDSISYYTYDGFNKSTNTKLNPNKMLFMFNSNNPKDSIYIENLEVKHISSFDCQDVFKEIPFIDIGT